MTAAGTPHIQTLQLMKDMAEDVAARAKRSADTLRTEYARQLLRGAFPGHSLAVFARQWDQHEPTLVQLLSSRVDSADLDLAGDAGDFSALTPTAKRAITQAERQIVRIGSDEDILEHLLAGDAEHDGWYEFNLPLHTQNDRP